MTGVLEPSDASAHFEAAVKALPDDVPLSDGRRLVQ